MNIFVGVEDDLSEFVARELVVDAVGRETEVRVLRGGGNSYLRKRLPNFLQLSLRIPLLLLTDLDLKQCAPGLTRDWLDGATKPERMSFRVAVREIESWIMADRENFADFLSVPLSRIPQDVEQIDHPKEFLMQLAKRAPRDVRSDLIRIEGSRTLQGLGYNSRLGQFVAERWNIRNAADCSPSLRRAVADLARFGKFIGATP